MHYLHEGAETHQPAASCSAVGFAQMKRNENMSACAFSNFSTAPPLVSGLPVLSQCLRSLSECYST